MRRYYSKAHYQRLADVSPGNDGKGQARIDHAKMRQSIYDTLVSERGPVTVENALEWINELNRRLHAADFEGK